MVFRFRHIAIVRIVRSEEHSIVVWRTKCERGMWKLSNPRNVLVYGITSVHTEMSLMHTGNAHMPSIPIGMLVGNENSTSQKRDSTARFQLFAWAVAVLRVDASYKCLGKHLHQNASNIVVHIYKPFTSCWPMRSAYPKLLDILCVKQHRLTLH